MNSISSTMKCVVVFLSVSLLCVYAGLIQSPAEVQLFLLQLRVRFLTNKLYEKCPELIENEGFLRERASDSLTVQENIEIELQIYKHVLALMTQCNEQQSNSTNTTWPTNITTTTMRTTTTTLLPAQCTSSATLNLTESWRNNWNGSVMSNSDVDLLKPGLTWFRFTEDGGNLLMNACAPKYSCGSTGAYWSNSSLPIRIGETVSITYYQNIVTTGCSMAGEYQGRATRCSADRGGVVYIMDEPMSGGPDTVCGMY